MSNSFTAQIQIAAFNFAPRGWALTNGQVLPINQNQALFSLLGTTYGGDGRTTFALPNMQSRLPVHVGNSYSLGQVGGAENVSLSTTPVVLPSSAGGTTASFATQPSIATAIVSPFLALTFIIALNGVFPSRN